MPTKSFNIPSYFSLDHIVSFLFLFIYFFSFSPQVLGIEYRASLVLVFATKLYPKAQLHHIYLWSIVFMVKNKGI